MFIPLKYGTKRASIGIHEPYPLQCPNCKQLNTVSYMIYSEYWHFYFIPIFPFEKDGYARCSNCSFHINSIKFNRLTKDEFKDIRKKFRHPFYTYIGITIFLAPIVIAIVLELIQ